MTTPQTLYVYMNGMLVGTLTRKSRRGLVFAYDVDWLHWEYTRPISLSMPLREAPYEGHVVDCFFDNLLPDSELIRQRIQTRFRAPSSYCFDLLSHIGGDCVGALQLLSEPQVETPQKIQATPIDDRDIANLLKHYQTAPLGMDQSLDFRISIAGAQEKTALLWYRKKWYLPHGTTPTSHIIKLPIGFIKHTGIDLSDSVENEWLCLQILSAYGLPVNHAEIIQFKDMKTLVVERFDRNWINKHRWLIRLPQEDLCQALGVSPGLKYESDGGPGIRDIMHFLLGSKDPLGDRKKFMQSVFLFWVMGAVDGHAKNFSIQIGPKGRYHLTPLYDVMSAYPLAAKRQMEEKKLDMAMRLKGKNKHYKWSTIQLRHWFEMAAQCHFSNAMMQEIIEEIFDRMEEVIDTVSTALPKKFPKEISEPIFAGMRKVKKHAGVSLPKKI